MEQHFSIRHVAESYGFTYQHVWNLVRGGQLSAVRVGRSLRIPESALKALTAKEVMSAQEDTP